MKKKIPLIIFSTLFSVCLLTACNQKTSEAPERSTANDTIESINKENSIQNIYYQSVGIMYDETNIDTYVKTLEKEAGIQNRKAIINTDISDGNVLIAIYGEETISDLALYTIDQSDFEKSNYNADIYVKKYLNTSNKITLTQTLNPTEYAIVRCDEPEGIPMYLIAWKDTNNQTQYFVVAYDGKGNE